MTDTDKEAMKEKYEKVNLAVEEIKIQPKEIVYKNLESVEDSKIEMQITLKPKIKPLLSATLIGVDKIKEDEEGKEAFRIKVGGTVLSEKVL